MPISVECPSCGKIVRAPDNAGGKRGKCPQCGTIIDIPITPIAAPLVPSPPPPKSKPAPPLTPSASEGEIYDAEEIPDHEESVWVADPTPKKKSTGDTRPCPACGEMIKAVAKKCRYCDEVFDKRGKKTEPEENLTTGDIVFCLLCSPVACLFGLVHGIRGTSRGWKMCGLSFVIGVLGLFVLGIIGSLNQ